MDTDLTINEDRYIRMPVKVLYLLACSLVVAAWAYLDIRTQISSNNAAMTTRVERIEQQLNSFVRADVQTVQNAAIQESLADLKSDIQEIKKAVR